MFCLDKAYLFLLVNLIKLEHEIKEYGIIIDLRNL